MMALEALTCPNCNGDVELDKDQEFGFCKYCGTKVQNTNFKVVKGKVKIDKSKDADNYYIIARRALNDNDHETAEKYYDMILQIDPNSWEALFYKTYCNAMNCKIIQINSSIIKLNNCLDSVFKLMKESVDEKELEDKISEIGNKANDLFLLLVHSYENHYNGIGDSIRANYNQEYINTHFSGLRAEEYMGDLLLKYFPDSKWVKNNYVTLLKTANQWQIRCIPKLANKQLNITEIHERTEKIKKYDENYVEPTISTGGCYVATCVYGSYDCPEVWTLRRFRDNYLDNHILGKLFIKCYYAVSPTCVKLFGKTKLFQKINKGILDPFVKKLNEKGYEDTKYNDKY